VTLIPYLKGERYRQTKQTDKTLIHTLGLEKERMRKNERERETNGQTDRDRERGGREKERGRVHI
jgi:hypothetical protein